MSNVVNVSTQNSLYIRLDKYHTRVGIHLQYMLELTDVHDVFLGRWARATD